MRAFKPYLGGGIVSAIDGGPQIRAPRRHSQHSPACSEEPAIVAGRARVEYFDSFNSAGIFKAHDLLACFKGARIPSRGNYHAHRSVLGPFEITFANPAFD